MADDDNDKAAGRSASQAMQFELKTLQATPQYQKMLNVRKSLPIWAAKQELLDAIAAHNVLLVVGDTGCGKSTQVCLVAL